jgi:four helix bundle protein
MSKVEILLPNEFFDSVEIKIRKIDMEINFVSIGNFILEANLILLNKYKLHSENIFGTKLRFSNSQIIFLGELEHDDTLKVEIAFMNYLEKSFTYVFKLSKSDNSYPIANASFKVGFIDSKTKKTVSVPSEFKNLFTESKITSIHSIEKEKSLLWQKSHSISLESYKETINYPKSEQEHLTAKIRKVATSLPLSIMELESKSTKEGIHKSLARCRGFIEELRYYLVFAKDLGYNQNQILIHDLNELESELKKEFLSI